MYHRLGGAGGALVVLAEPAAVFQPCKRSLDYPASGQDFEAFALVVAFDDLQIDLSMYL